MAGHSQGGRKLAQWPYAVALQGQMCCLRHCPLRARLPGQDMGLTRPCSTAAPPVYQGAPKGHGAASWEPRPGPGPRCQPRLHHGAHGNGTSVPPLSPTPSVHPVHRACGSLNPHQRALGWGAAGPWQTQGCKVILCGTGDHLDSSISGFSRLLPNWPPLSNAI